MYCNFNFLSVEFFCQHVGEKSQHYCEKPQQITPVGEKNNVRTVSDKKINIYKF